MFSLLPRCHGECGSQKNTPAPVVAVICWCWELLALIPGQRPAQRGRQRRERCAERQGDGLGRRDAVLEVQQDQISGRALNERADR